MKRLRIVMAALVFIPTIIVVLLCVAFPPRRWADGEASDYRPSRGRIFVADTTDRDWMSSHMYRERAVSRDSRRLIYECSIVVVTGTCIWFVCIAFWREYDA